MIAKVDTRNVKMRDVNLCFFFKKQVSRWFQVWLVKKFGNWFVKSKIPTNHGSDLLKPGWAF